ncbi:hypothetical protein EV174_000474 [Coemansia sp. RSA 2320]|nr:hypothetical protein EV174_000474 [Coemansia sp. RSA 2320]
MIPDEKKPVPWGLPPLRAEVQRRRRAEAEAAAAALPQTSLSTSECEKLGTTDCRITLELNGYRKRSPARERDFMSVRKRLLVFLAGAVMMVGAVLYIRLVMYNPAAIDPSAFSATTLGTNPDTLEVVDKLLHAGFDESNTVAWDRLAEMTDLYGHRMTASSGYSRSAAWVVHTVNTQDANLTAYTEPVRVDEWRRYEESLSLYVPTRDRGQVEVPVLGLGNSVPTPSDGIMADVIPVRSFDELRRLGNATIAGNIVLYNFDYTTYGDVVAFRTRGAVEAEKFGAVAVLVRSITPDSEFASVHTGNSRRAKIPAAAISPADANFMERMYVRAQTKGNGYPRHVAPRVNLKMNSNLVENMAHSVNVIVDLPGTDRAQEIVLLSGHFDSWDVGVGAMDDGAGAFLAWEAARLISKTSRAPRRSIRVVMWSNEETFQRGAKAYFDRHEHEMAQHVFAIESDIGVFAPWGLSVAADKKTVASLRNYGNDLLKILGAGNITSAEVESPGEDIAILCQHGVPCAGFLSVNPENGAVPGQPQWENHYFRYHHASSDRVEAIDKHQLRRSAAALAAWAYLIADL